MDDIKITYQGRLPALAGFKHADKVTHAIYGGVAGAAGALIAYKLGLPVHGVSIASAACVAVGKEIYDAKVRKVQWDAWDIVATIALPVAAAIITK